MIWVGYTAGYRTGGPHLRQAAETLARQLRARGKDVRLHAVETKRAFVEATREGPLEALHLIGHSGMYGPMFGTTDLPEQFSPHEWRELDLPFADGAEAFFHACRTGRWFAPFFARTFGVPTSGHHWYTTVSRSPDRWRKVPDDIAEDADVYVIGQPGRTSHGLLGAVGKRTGWLPPAPMVRHEPVLHEGADYDRVATKYDALFEDIRVRAVEWAWLHPRVPEGARVLDLGCGTGALLRALSEERGVDGTGVDVSGAMLERARARDPERSFVQLDGPRLPFPDDHFDAVTSLLSWRYLDWDPILAEIARVLRPGGHLLVVDMVAKAAALGELPRVARDKARTWRNTRRFPGFLQARRQLVTDPAWAEMLRYNPIRAEHEYRWYLESRFPGRAVETLDVGRHTRILAFDSGPITTSWFPPQSYP